MTVNRITGHAKQDTVIHWTNILFNVVKHVHLVQELWVDSVSWPRHTCCLFPYRSPIIAYTKAPKAPSNTRKIPFVWAILCSPSARPRYIKIVLERRDTESEES